MRILLRGDAISTHFLAKSKILIKVYTTIYWKPKSRSPPPVFIPRPRHLPFILSVPRGWLSLKKKLQPLRRLTQKFHFFVPLRSCVASLASSLVGGVPFRGAMDRPRRASATKVGDGGGGGAVGGWWHSYLFLLWGSPFLNALSRFSKLTTSEEITTNSKQEIPICHAVARSCHDASCPCHEGISKKLIIKLFPNKMLHIFFYKQNVTKAISVFSSGKLKSFVFGEVSVA